MLQCFTGSALPGGTGIHSILMHCLPLTCSGSSLISSNFSFEIPCAMITLYLLVVNLLMHKMLLLMSRFGILAPRLYFKVSNDEVSGPLNQVLQNQSLCHTCRFKSIKILSTSILLKLMGVVS